MGQSDVSNLYREQYLDNINEMFGQGLSPPGFKKKSMAKPSCTHTRMDILHGDYTCELCKQKPSMGWVYLCEQDSEFESTESGHMKHSARPSLNESKHCIAELEQLGFSKSVICAAEAGLYTPGQLTRLKDQRRHVKYVIASVGGNSEPSISMDKHVAALLADRATVLNEIKTSDTNSTKSRLQEAKLFKKNKDRAITRPPKKKCEFKCCHACRPVSRDRTFFSLDAILRNEVNPPKEWHPDSMLVVKAEIARGLGLKRPKSHSPSLLDMNDFYENAGVSMKTSEDHDDDADNVSNISLSTSTDDQEIVKENLLQADRFHQLGSADPSTTTRSREGRPESQGFRASLRRALVDMLKRNSESSSQESELFQAAQDNCHKQEEEKLETMLFKVMSDEIQVVAASTELPGGESNEELKEAGADSEENESICTDNKIKGRVALTEEAAEMQSLDVFTQL